MHRPSTSFVLAYHGCDERVAEALLTGHDFVPSQNAYDWLGHGVCFWEANPDRGVEFAREASRRAGRPPMVPAAVDLGLCLDLTTPQGVAQVRSAHRFLREFTDADGSPLPSNSADGLRRKLDCAVINFLHRSIDADGGTPIDTVRGIFTEGAPIHPGSGFHEKTHVQVCVRTLSCIKGVLRVLPAAFA